jgi:hypothetical protein
MRIRRAVAALVATSISAMGLVVAAQPAQAYPPAPGYILLQNAGSGLCVTVYPGSPLLNGADVVQFGCHGWYEQWWKPVYVGNGYYHFVNYGSGKCLDVRDGVNADRTPVQQWDCTSTPGMAWKAPNGLTDGIVTRLTSRIGGRCLDVRDGSLAEFAVIQIYRCTANNYAQQWIVRV